ncbi:MAG: hypothetical protein KGJ23_12515 [Euryarchaeota archaeon]|nr:hypothetical protein [Euryarchaeota archaeon]MDE1837421.1 hypothetical protein [Euryarchaeota archaeon]MDE1879896.1 hypothetical protein [Euryarchaeota archaeon]MDE2045479.1 hypothetical protein [Thermoplasmata archaeon]
MSFARTPLIPEPIARLAPNREAMVYGTISKAHAPREIPLSGGRRRPIQELEFEDASGRALLVLWGEEIGMAREGDRVLIAEAWVKHFQGRTCLSLGKYGRLVLCERSPSSLAAPEAAPGPQGPTTLQAVSPLEEHGKLSAPSSEVHVAASLDPPFRGSSEGTAGARTVVWLSDPGASLGSPREAAYEEYTMRLVQARRRENRNRDGW